MMETARIRRAGFPVRYDYADFVDRFRVLRPASCETDARDAAEKICAAALVDRGDTEYQLGRTKVFMKERDDAILERERCMILGTHAAIIQRYARRWIYRRR